MNLGGLYEQYSFRPPLISKGLRLLEQFVVDVGERFQATPDFKGIKTEA